MEKDFSDLIAKTMSDTMDSEAHLKIFKRASLKKEDKDESWDAKDGKEKDHEDCGDMNYADDEKQKDKEKEDKVSKASVVNKLLSLSQDLEDLKMVKSADLSLRLLDILISEAKEMTAEEKKKLKLKKEKEKEKEKDKSKKKK